MKTPPFYRSKDASSGTNLVDECQPYMTRPELPAAVQELLKALPQKTAEAMRSHGWQLDAANSGEDVRDLSKPRRIPWKVEDLSTLGSTLYSLRFSDKSCSIISEKDSGRIRASAFWHLDDVVLRQSYEVEKTSGGGTTITGPAWAAIVGGPRRDATFERNGATLWRILDNTTMVAMAGGPDLWQNCVPYAKRPEIPQAIQELLEPLANRIPPR